MPKKHWEHLDLGNFCHTTLELFHKEYMDNGLGRYDNLNAIMTYAFAEAKRDKEFVGLGRDSLEAAKDMMIDYLDELKKHKMPNVLCVEQDFEFNIAPDIVLRGYIDRIDKLDNGRLRVVDYKTSKSGDRYLENDQLLIYGMWLKRQHPELKDFMGSYVLLKFHSRAKDVDFNTADLEKMESKLLKYAGEIKTENEWITIPSGLCKYCDFYDICPAQKGW